MKRDHRSSKDDGAQQLLFGEFAPDELFDLATRVVGRRKPFQAKVSQSALRGFSPAKAL